MPILPPKPNSCLKVKRSNSLVSTSSGVSFDDVTIYEFPIQMGDNPSCSTGCPIALGRKHRSVIKLDLDSHEESKRPQLADLVTAAIEKKQSSKRRPSSSGNLMESFSTSSSNNNNTTTRRSSRQLLIPSDVRTKMLLAHGYDFHQIVKGTEACLTVQGQRKESMQKTSWEGVKSFLSFGNGSAKTQPSIVPTPNRPTAKSA